MASNADVKAVEFNERVWGSQCLTDTLRCIADAREELMDGKGWGLIALENARHKLEEAIDFIRQMEGWK